MTVWAHKLHCHKSQILIASQFRGGSSACFRGSSQRPKLMLHSGAHHRLESAGSRPQMADKGVYNRKTQQNHTLQTPMQSFCQKRCYRSTFQQNLFSSDKVLQYVLVVNSGICSKGVSKTKIVFSLNIFRHVHYIIMERTGMVGFERKFQ